MFKQVQMFTGPPCDFQNVLKSDRCQTADLSTLSRCILLGGHVPSVLIQSAKQLLPQCVLFTAYGLTEIGGGSTLITSADMEKFPGCAGCLVPGTFMKIIDESTGNKCGVGEKGEIHVKLSIPWLGYFRDDEANYDAFDLDDFCVTGDIGYFDKDGRLYVSGRKKEIFKNRGHAIWPAEIEDVLLKNPSIRNVCVTPITDDELMTDLPAAVVVKNENHTITCDEVYAIVSGKVWISFN